jgi:hypothetical protein
MFSSFFSQGLKLTALDIANRVGDNFGGRDLRTKEYLRAAGGKTYNELQEALLLQE